MVIRTMMLSGGGVRRHGQLAEADGPPTGIPRMSGMRASERLLEVIIAEAGVVNGKTEAEE